LGSTGSTAAAREWIWKQEKCDDLLRYGNSSDGHNFNGKRL